MRRLLLIAALGAGASVLGAAGDAQASSHREAPFVTKNPKVDSSDFYMFRSYETGKDANVTIIANYEPLQDAYGGPNYFTLDDQALYEIHIDNNGDGAEDITFQFQFKNNLSPDGTGLTLPITLDGTTKTNNVPLINLGGVTFADTSKLQVQENYTINVVKGDRRTGTVMPVTGNFRKPMDFTGTGTFASVGAYDTYAKAHISNFDFNGCTGSRVFVGQRREGFAANIGPIFDLLQANDPGSAAFGAAITSGNSSSKRGRNNANVFDTGTLYDKNVTSIAIEVPIACLITDTDHPIIGGWTSASLHQARVLNPAASYAVPAKEGGAWTQVSHLGMPLVNEVVIGLKDKDLFNAVSPKSTSAVADYVTNPTLPAIIESVYGAAGAKAPVKTRTDLVGVFATGLTVTLSDGTTQLNLTQTSTGPGNTGPTGNTLPAALAEYLRLNTSDGPGGALKVRSKTQQTNMQDAVLGLGALGCFNAARQVDPTDPTLCDPVGFPNGRRPGDDVVDITLRVAMGALFASSTDAPANNIPFTDANFNSAEQFDDTFPYLRTPLGGNQTTTSQK
jgi:hypothetical protein